MAEKSVQQLTQLTYASGARTKVDFSMYKDLGISEILLNFVGQIDSSGVVAETVDNPYALIEELKITFDGSKVPFRLEGKDLRGLHRLYNGTESDVLIAGANKRNYADTTNDQTVQFLLKLPVFIPANIFTRASLEIKWTSALTDISTNLTVDNFDVYPSIIWDDAVPFMLNFATEEQTYSGKKEFKPPFSETLRHIIVRVTDYTDSIGTILLKKQRTTIIESRYFELLVHQSDIENLPAFPVLGDNAQLRYGFLVVTTPAGIVSDDTTILNVQLTASKTVNVLWVNIIPLAMKEQPKSKVDFLKFLKI